MEKNLVRTYELSTDKIETLDDVKKILSAMKIRINTDNPLFEELSDYFPVEVVPKGYIRLLKAVGHEEVAKMSYDEMREKISTLPDVE